MERENPDPEQKQATNPGWIRFWEYVHIIVVLGGQVEQLASLNSLAHKLA